MLAADHVIENIPAFHAAVATAERLAETGKLVTFGIKADHPETGYGYIRRGAAVSSARKRWQPGRKLRMSLLLLKNPMQPQLKVI